MLTFDEFVKESEGKTVGYPANSYVGECLSLTKWHIKKVLGIDPPSSGCNAARCYWSLFKNPLGTVLKKVPYVAGMIPRKGWIVVWDFNVGNGYGHIASVISANANTFVSLDQNWGGEQAHKVTHNYNNIYGFLVPINEKVEFMPNELETCQTDRQKFWGERDDLHRALGVDKQTAALVEIKRLKARDADYTAHKCPIINIDVQKIKQSLGLTEKAQENDILGAIKALVDRPEVQEVPNGSSEVEVPESHNDFSIVINGKPLKESEFKLKSIILEKKEG